MIHYKAISADDIPIEIPTPKSAVGLPWLVTRFEGDALVEVCMGFDTGVEAALVASWMWSAYLRGINEGVG